MGVLRARLALVGWLSSALFIAPGALVAAPWRAPVSTPAVDGWQWLPLSAEAQRDADSLWLAGADGKLIPFLRDERLARHEVSIELDDLVQGVDDEGRATVELTPRAAAVARAGGPPREMRVHMAVTGETPWVARLAVERRHGDGAWIARDGEPLWLDDLGGGRRRDSVSIPWDGDRFRLRLEALEAKPLRIESVSVRAATGLDVRRFESTIDLRVEGPNERAGSARWRLMLPAVDRVVACELRLEPPVAPVAAELFVHAEGARTEPRRVGSSAIWDLPALAARSGRIELVRPERTAALELTLPAGVALHEARAIVRRELLLFPAAAGERLSLHGGGAPRRAAGNLGALEAGADLAARSPLALGVAEPDPGAAPRRVTFAERLRSLLLPLVLLLAALLAWFAWRLFRESAAS